MNVAESTDVQTVLNHLLGTIEVDDYQARKAAGRLARRSYQALGTGLTEGDVHDKWRIELSVRWPGR